MFSRTARPKTLRLLLALSISVSLVAMAPIATSACETSPPPEPFNMEVVSQDGGAGDTGIFMADDVAYVTSDTGLRLVDVSAPGTPTAIGSFATTETAKDVVVDGDKAYVGGEDGLTVLDISTPTTPTLLGVLDMDPVKRVAFYSGRVYGVVDAGLVVVDVSDPTFPTATGDWASQKTAWDVSILDDRAYVTYGPEDGTDSYAVELDLSDPDAPVKTASHYIPSNKPTVSASSDVTHGAYAYVSIQKHESYSAIKVFDVSDPGTLSYKKWVEVDEKGTADITSEAGQVTVTGSESTQVWGLYSPDMPYQMGWIDVGGERLARDGDLIGVTKESSGTAFIEYSPVSYRAFGKTRYETAIELSKQFDSSEYMVLATGGSYPDALAGVPLAYALDCPILLTTTAYLPQVVLDEIERLGATKAYVLGGTGAVSDTVVTQLVDAGMDAADVKRLGGNDRYETAEAIAKELESILGKGSIEKVYVATGLDFPDALAASGAAAKDGCPVVLTGDHLPAATAQAIQALGADEAVVLGGTGAVSDTVVAELVLAGIDPLKVTRLQGPTRYETAKAVADWSLIDPDTTFDADDVYVATGLNFPDALASGVLAAEDSAPTLLVGSSVPWPTQEFLEDHKDEVDELNVIGGTGALSTETEKWLEHYAD